MAEVVVDRLALVRCVAWSWLIVLAGCAEHEPRGTVAGRVTLQGEPVAGGTIAFSSDETGTHMTATISADGTYRATSADGAGLRVGLYRVFLYPPLAAPTGPWRLPGPDVPPPKFDPRWPARYHDAETSGLTLQVAAGENQFDVDLIP